MNLTVGHDDDGSQPRVISSAETMLVVGGMIKVDRPDVKLPSAGLDDGWTWGTVSDLPASKGVGIVILF
jgi:hypothetical protein